MENFEHRPSARGQLFLWGGIAAGLVLVLLLYTRGFGLFARHAGEPAAPLARASRHSDLYSGVLAAARAADGPARRRGERGATCGPGVVESDPARTALLLPRWPGV